VPEFLAEMLILGVYRILAWVVSVMLPPMASFIKSHILGNPLSEGIIQHVSDFVKWRKNSEPTIKVNSLFLALLCRQ